MASIESLEKIGDNLIWEEVQGPLTPSSDIGKFLEINGFDSNAKLTYNSDGSYSYKSGIFNPVTITAYPDKGIITKYQGAYVTVYTTNPATTGAKTVVYNHGGAGGRVSPGVTQGDFADLVNDGTFVNPNYTFSDTGDKVEDTGDKNDDSSTSGVDDKISSVDDGPWYGEYNGNVIFYDKNQTAGAKTVLNVLSESFEEQSNQIEANDGYFDSVPSRYESLIPDPRYADIKGEISQAFEDAHTELIATIDSISESILELSRGELSDNGKLILDSWLRYKDSPGIPDDDGGSPDSGGGIPDGGIGDIPVDNLNDNGDVAGENPDVGGNGDVDNLEDDVKNLGTSEDYVIPVLEDFNHVNELTDGDDKVIDSDDKLDSFKGDYSTSSNSLFSIPTPTNKIEGVKKSSGVGFAAATVAAVASGVGGKFYYDYKHSDDEEEKDDENSDDDVAEEVNDHLTDNTNPDIPINSVDLKNKILEDAEEEKRND